MTRRVAVRSLLSLLLLLSAGCVGLVPDGEPTPDGSVAAAETTARVTAVVDGDTVRVRLANGSTDTVRLLGVDTPEVRAENDPAEFEGVPETEAGRTCLRRHGERASEFAVERLADRRVTLRFDDAAGRRGGYGRLLAYVEVGNRSFNAALLEHGHARLYDGPFRERDRYAALERDARDANRGLWGCTSA